MLVLVNVVIHVYSFISCDKSFWLYKNNEFVRHTDHIPSDTLVHKVEWRRKIHFILVPRDKHTRIVWRNNWLRVFEVRQWCIFLNKYGADSIEDCRANVTRKGNIVTNMRASR